MRHTPWILLVGAAFAASCNCGGTGGHTGSGLPCSTTSDCPSTEECMAGRCWEPERSDGGDGGSHPDGGCVGLECQQQACAGGAKTVLTGTVYTPKGDLALYNAIVYVPNGTPTAFTPGVSCDRCAAATGNPLVTTTTGADGKFRLENVPVGSNIPLVIQMGRWRRQVTIPSVPACVETAITDTSLTRLPRNHVEGDIPKMAIATGSADPFECLLRKVGIDDAEITLPTGNGRVHYYEQNGVPHQDGTAAASTLWSSIDTMRQYDVVMLPCEGTGHGPHPAGQTNLVTYTSEGGRVFATHFSYEWINGVFPAVASWDTSWTTAESNYLYNNPYTIDIDTSFEKGDSFADWLVNVGASSTKGKLSLIETRHNVLSVMTPQAQRWMYGTVAYSQMSSNPTTDQPIVGHLTFNTPVSSDPNTTDQCGRVVFSSFHVSGTSALKNGASDPTTFPGICKDEPPTAQEKALIFMLFDLSACVQRDDIPVIN